WNNVGHRLFCSISKNRHGKPPVDVQSAVALIGSTRTSTGLTVICVRDDREYQLAREVSDKEFETIAIDNIPPFESWNYKIVPRLNSHVII
ncbi:MAG: ISAzo13 family transposase, partial [Treponema sp.]|nr:ISAzo13 family transposase [Treponema sp.]